MQALVATEMLPSYILALWHYAWWMDLWPFGYVRQSLTPTRSGERENFSLDKESIR